MMKMLNLAIELKDRHKKLMIDTTEEAEKAASIGDVKRQSIASTESERHRFLVMHLDMLIREGEDDEYRMDQLAADSLVLKSYMDANARKTGASHD